MKTRSLLLTGALLLAGNIQAAEEAFPQAVSRSVADYRLPDVMLTRADGARVRFLDEIDDGRPVILNFVETSCPAVCPVMTRTLAAVQNRLDSAGAPVHMISVSMDPREDTPSRMRVYAKRHGAGARWNFYTGSPRASHALQKGFRARSESRNHAPVTFIRRTSGGPWIRLEGFATPEEILGEFRQSVAVR